METHICLLFDGDDAIIRSTTIAMAENGTDAREKAHALLAQTPGAAGFELWLNGDRIWSHFPNRDKDTAH